MREPFDEAREAARSAPPGGWRAWRRATAWSIALLAVTFAWFWFPPSVPPIEWPEGKRFAFTIVDDADGGTVESVEAVYDFLYEQGLRTTKTVWTLPSVDTLEWPNRGESLADPSYLDFVFELRDRGFEIASHGVRGGSSERPVILEGMEEYRRLLGEPPRLHVNHFHNREDLYWGDDRFVFPPVRWAYRVLTDNPSFEGHIEGTPYFWGDFVRDNIDYTVNFTYTDIDLYDLDPIAPFHQPRQSYVDYWFHTSDGGNLPSFVELLRNENLERLEKSGGFTIVYTHFGHGFVRDGLLDEGFQRVIRDVASRDGWFVPASELLDHVRSQAGRRDRHTFRERARLELRWFIQKLMNGPG